MIERWRGKLPLAWIVGTLSALLSALAVWSVAQIAEGKSRLEYRTGTADALGRVRERLDRELQTVLGVPETVAAFVAARGDLDDETFAAVVARLVDTNKHIRNLALAPEMVIRTIYPLAGNEKAIGLRYLDLPPEQSDAVRRAIESRRTVVAGPIKPVQGGLGIASRTPVFRGAGAGAKAGAAKADPFWGIVSLLVNADSLFAEVGFRKGVEGFEIAARGSDATGARGPVFAGPQHVFAMDPVTLDYPLPGGGSWQLAAIPVGGWERVGRVPAIVSVFAYLLAALVGFLSYRLTASHLRIRELAVQDRLTGLPNRRLFEDRLAQAMSAARRHGRNGALMLVDLDRFKPVNDAHGHRAGDETLVRTGQRLAGLVRGSDSVARIGGDEFALVLPEIQSREEAIAVARRVVEALAEPIPLPDKASAAIGASVGVAVFPRGEESLAALIERADRALYRAKRAGGSQADIDAAEAVGPRP